MSETDLDVEAARDRPFVLKWRSAVLNSAMTGTQKLCLLVLAEWADADGTNCWPAMASIAGKASVNEKTVRRSLDEAEPMGWFSRSHRRTQKGWKQFEYTLLIPVAADTESCRRPDAPGTVSATGSRCNGHSEPLQRTLAPDAPGTVSTDLALDLGSDLGEEHAPIPKLKVARSKEQTYRQWVESTPEDRELIPAEDPVFDYAQQIGMPKAILRLHWHAFMDRFDGDSKRYRDWRQVFRNSVRGNWFKLWYLTADGSYQLTTQGRQADRQHGTGIAGHADVNRLPKLVA